MSDNYSDRGYLEHVVNDIMPRHVTGKPGQVCSYCGEALPEEAIGNPTWPWKSNQGRGFSVFCTKDCMDWKRYRMRMCAFRNSTKKKISEEEFVDNLTRDGLCPTGPDPMFHKGAEKPSETPTDAPQEEPHIDEPAQEEPKTEPVQAETEAVEEEDEKETESMPEQKKNRLKRTVNEVLLEGEYIKASVYKYKNDVIVELDTETNLAPDMVAELRELADSLEKLLEVDAL